MGTADNMAKILLIIKCVLYFIIWLFGFMAAVPVGNTSSDFDGECLMDFDFDDDRYYFGSKSKCNYVIAIHVLFSILFAMAMMALHGFALLQMLRGRTFEVLNNFIVQLVLLTAHAIITFLCFVAACVITDGFRKFCNQLEDRESDAECSDFENSSWDDHDGSSFYKNYKLAISACWLATLVWGIVTAIFAFLLWKKIRNRGSGNTDMTTSTSTTTTTTTTSVSVVDKY